MMLNEMKGTVRNSVILGAKLLELEQSYYTRDELKSLIKYYFSNNHIRLNENNRKDKRLLRFIMRSCEDIAFNNEGLISTFEVLDNKIKDKLHINLDLLSDLV